MRLIDMPYSRLRVKGISVLYTTLRTSAEICGNLGREIAEIFQLRTVPRTDLFDSGGLGTGTAAPMRLVPLRTGRSGWASQFREPSLSVVRFAANKWHNIFSGRM